MFGMGSENVHIENFVEVRNFPGVKENSKSSKSISASIWDDTV